jgi:hypothetical protein
LAWFHEFLLRSSPAKESVEQVRRFLSDRLGQLDGSGQRIVARVVNAEMFLHFRSPCRRGGTPGNAGSCRDAVDTQDALRPGRILGEFLGGLGRLTKPSQDFIGWNA